MDRTEWVCERINGIRTEFLRTRFAGQYQGHHRCLRILTVRASGLSHDRVHTAQL